MNAHQQMISMLTYKPYIKTHLEQLDVLGHLLRLVLMLVGLDRVALRRKYMIQGLRLQVWGVGCRVKEIARWPRSPCSQPRAKALGARLRGLGLKA